MPVYICMTTFLKTAVYIYVLLYCAIEITANQNTGKPLYTDGITPNLPIMRHAYLSLVVLTTVFSMSGFKICNALWPYTIECPFCHLYCLGAAPVEGIAAPTCA